MTLWLRMHPLGLALLLTTLPSPASAGEVLLASDPANGMKVFAEAKAGSLQLKSLGPAYMSVSYEIDVNGNGSVDSRVDRAYGLTQAGRFCAAYQLTEQSETTCGGAPSGGTGSREDIGEQRITRIAIPLSEVSSVPGSYQIKVRLWNERSKARIIREVTYRPGRAEPVVGVSEPPTKPAPVGFRCPESASAMLSLLAGKRLIRDQPREGSGFYAKLAEKDYDPQGFTIMGKHPVKVNIAYSSDGIPFHSTFWMPGHDPAPYEAPFRAMAPAGEVSCSKYGCSWASKKDFWKDTIGALRDVQLTQDIRDDQNLRLTCGYKSY